MEGEAGEVLREGKKNKGENEEEGKRGGIRVIFLL